ncbi:hypothetical protein BC833DRAFT_260720 [Globomyces pollinis-pini]|nr:hypothetical protein BC833DRAFT_260720 [Globomyces pollinis-pini]
MFKDSLFNTLVHATMCGIEEAVQNIKLTSSIIGLILCAILAISAYFLFRRVLEKPNVFSRFIRSRLGISPNERNPVNGTPTIVVVPSNDDLELAPLDEKQKNSNLSQLFLEKYPQGNEVYDLPPTSISMQPLRLYTDFPFEGDQPKVVLGPNISGKQFIRFETTEICSIQCNLPVLNVDKSANSFDPPPAFDSDDITELDYSKTIGSYYEVKIVRLPTSSTSMAFGYASQPCPPFRLPGWDPYSIAYHTKTGLVFSSEKPFGINCGPTLCEGDTLGVGYTKVDQRYHFYFIVNRKRMALQVDYPIVDKVTLYPTIGTGWDCELLVNFGN